MVMMRAGLALLACFFVGCWNVAQAPAQQPPPATPPSATPPPLSVMVVDVQSLAAELQSGEDGPPADRRQTGGIPKGPDPPGRRAAQGERGAAAPAGDAVRRSNFKAKGRELQGKVNQYERDLQSKRQALERSNADALKQIDEVVKKVIYDIAKDRKVNLVLQRGELLLYDPAYDVTDQVLQKLDDQLPTLTVNFVAPVRGGRARCRRRHRSPGTPAAADVAPKPPKKR